MEVFTGGGGLFLIRVCDRVASMRIIERKPVVIDKIGRVNRNGVKTEPGEDSTILYLTQFGFDIDLIMPTSIKNMNNPDIMIMNSVWEIKTPSSYSKATIKKRFRKAANQAGRIIFDLRNVKKNSDAVEKQIIDLFSEDGTVRRMIIIEKTGKVIDIFKR